MLAYLMGVSARRRLHVPLLLAALTAALWVPAVARADEPQFTSGPTIQGDAVVGSTLTALATWTPPDATAAYGWYRCPAAGGDPCPRIPGASGKTYVITPADVGSRLVVVIAITSDDKTQYGESAGTAVVAPAPTPTASPPASTPPNPATPTALTPIQVTAASSAKPAAPFLDPFPVVRIRGFFARTGARITLLSVRGPRNAKVSARCVGRRCPVKTVTLPRANVRLHTFERFLHAGIRLQIRVTKPGRIGSYTSFLIRAGKAPLRTQRCLTKSGRPVACSAP
jgi:hypothetical protein